MTMVVQWRRVCFTMMTVNVVLMLATLAVAIAWFTQPRVPPPPCPPDPGMTSARVSSLAPPSTAESDVMKLTRETMQQAFAERQNNFHEAELFRKTMLPDPKSNVSSVTLQLNSSQTFIRDKNLLWNNSQSRLQGFEYDESGYLRVLQDGYYFIYAHLQYEQRPENGFDRDRLKDYIFKTEKRFVDDPNLRERMKKKLLFNEQTPCRVVSHAIPRTSSTLGAVVYLRHDDMLSVACGLPEYTSSENTISRTVTSFFGVSPV